MEGEQRETLIRIAAGTVLGGAAFVLCRLFSLPWWAQLLIYLPGYLAAGGEVLIGAIKNIFHGEFLDEEFLMSAATVGALAIGEYPEAVAVMVLYMTGEFLGDLAGDRSRTHIEALIGRRPDTVTLLRGGEETVCAASDVAVGDVIIVKPGEMIPLDGTVTGGTTTVDTSSLTGESLPAEAVQGDKVYSGTVNLSGAITVTVTSAEAESSLAKILRMVEESSENKARSEGFIQRFSKIYTPAVVIAAVLLAVVPPLFTGEWGKWIYRALSFLVVSCPCALIISVPLTFFSGIGGASANGILIKGQNYIEALAKADTAAFDKTGTLTTGRLGITGIFPQGMSENGLLAVCAAAERYSDHPVGAAIREAAEARGADYARLSVSDVSESAGHTGRGVSARVDGHRVLVGNEAFAGSAGVFVPTHEYGGTVIYAIRDGAYAGCITIGDTVRDDAEKALSGLRKNGIHDIIMLTGDVRASAAAAAEKLGLPEDKIYSGLFPEEKAEIVGKLTGEGRNVIFIGDGMNDAPVIAAASAGIAMGALGSDAAIEASDVLIMDDSLEKLPAAIAHSKRTMRIVRENIVFSLAVKAVILALNAFGITGLWMAALGDVGVMLIAVLNSLRAFRFVS